MNPHLPSPISYREDINGLRAWAVLAVIAFHFSFLGLSGGFVGVDVFFVISGYLMTAIVVSKLRQSSFNLWAFYLSRLRRVVPALLVLVLVLLLLGWLLLPSQDYNELGKQSASAVGFVSNVYFWRSSGYFDSVSESKWLLHTWSLAVEAQFYLFYPIFLMLVWRWFASMRAVLLSLALLLVFSFVLNLIVAAKLPTAVFYLLPTRTWEFLVGGFVYFAWQYQVFAKLSQSLKSVFYTLGWIGLLFALWVFEGSNCWPCYQGVLPVLATAMILLFAPRASILTHHAVAQWLGNRSYSLYLWHWPFVVVLYFVGVNESWPWVMSALVVAIVLAHLSYIWVEVPTRLYFRGPSLRVEWRYLLSALVVVGSFALYSAQTKSNRLLNPQINIASSEAQNRNWQAYDCRYRNFSQSSPKCQFGEGEVSAILVGDSHSELMASPVAQAAQQYEQSLLYLGGANGCPAIRGLEDRPLCNRYWDYIERELSQMDVNLPLIVANGSWNEYLHQPENQRKLQQMVCDWRDSGREVYLIRQIPQMPELVPQFISKQLLFGHEVSDVSVSYQAYRAQYAHIWQAQDQVAQACGAKILDLSPYLCADGVCKGSENLRPYYYDDTHLSEFGVQLLTPMFTQIFANGSLIAAD